MKDVEVYGRIIQGFVQRMTGPNIGQFRLEISTFRIILERERAHNPSLVKFSITENGQVVNNLNDNEESLESLRLVLKRSFDFISSLMGEDLARDLVQTTMREEFAELLPELRTKHRIVTYLPEPFLSMVKGMLGEERARTTHQEIITLFLEMFDLCIKDLATRSDLSALKLKLNILREKFRLIRSVELRKNNTISIDREQWESASDEEVRDALVAIFDSLVGLSTLLVGKEEAMKKASRTLQYHFQGKMELLEKYRFHEKVLDGALSKKVSTGQPDLDKRLGGGIPKGSSLLFASPTGIERDIFISRMLTKALQEGASVLMVLSKEPPRSIRMLLKSQGLDPESLEEEGRLRFVDWFTWRNERIIGVEKDGYALKSSKILSNLGIAINKGLRELSFSQNKIGILHMIGPALNIFDFSEVYNFVQRLRAKFKDEEMASLFLLEAEALDSEQGGKLVDVFDGTIQLLKTAEAGRFRRELSILNLSGVDFDGSPIVFTIKDNNIVPLHDKMRSRMVRTVSRVPAKTQSTIKEKAPGPAGKEPAIQDRPAAKSPSPKGEGKSDIETWKETQNGRGGIKVETDDGGGTGAPDPKIENTPETAQRPRNDLKSPPPSPVKPRMVRKWRKAPTASDDRILPSRIGSDAAVNEGEEAAKKPSFHREPSGENPPPSSRKAFTVPILDIEPDHSFTVLDEIDLKGSKSSPQRLILDAIDTIDELLKESETNISPSEGKETESVPKTKDRKAKYN